MPDWPDPAGTTAAWAPPTAPPAWQPDQPPPPVPPRRGRRGPAAPLLAALALVVLLALVAAVVLVVRAGRKPEPAATGGVANASADEVWHACQAAIRSATSVRVTGNTLLELPNLERWQLDLTVTRQGDATGVYRHPGGDVVELRRVGSRLYVRGKRLFRGWGEQAAARVGDRWVLVPPALLRDVGVVDGGIGSVADSPEALIRAVINWSFANYQGIDVLAHDRDGLLGRDPDKPVPLRKRPGSTVVDGTPAVAVEQGDFYLLVAASGPPYPLEHAPLHGSGTISGHWRFSRWNAPVRVEAPRGAVDLVDVKP